MATRGENSGVGLACLAPARPERELRSRLSCPPLVGQQAGHLKPIVRRDAAARLLPGT
ncbi:hypothetical protein [Streptomyces sp. NPDC058157]|uniref:hypothetical protein n=1 Tax=Streptomyces sp. NPDC058157 TaxID=3346360 RepID=UPI0036EDF025